MSEYVPLSTIIEDPVEAFKDELESLGIFERINEGEEIYLGAEPWAMVIPGPDRILLAGNQQLQHRITLYVNFIQGVGDANRATLADLRDIAHLGFNKLMEDLTHNDTCHNCLPISWNPGFMAWGEYRFLGVQTVWVGENWQTFPLPDYPGRAYTDMENVVETVIARFKTELEAVTGIDDISEGDEPYPGEGTVAWVLPGEDTITQRQYGRLEHAMTIYQCLLSSSPTMPFSEMRAIGEAAYDALMADITHNRTCSDCIPTLWHPGILEYGDLSFVGIQANWRARVLHNYTPT